MTLQISKSHDGVDSKECEATCHVMRNSDLTSVPIIDSTESTATSDMPGGSDATSATVPSTSRDARRAAREQERHERLHGKLTALRFSDLIRARMSTSSSDGAVDVLKRGVLRCVLGSKSQFDARNGRLRDLMPPLTGDCCQTFATLSAVLLSSLTSSVITTECCCTSTVNYLLYISAWMHQLSLTSWPQGGVRPTVSDLDTCLHLRQFFPSKVNANEFDVVFYNQAHKAKDLLRQLCTHGKRGRDSEGKFMPCGYVIVSGDYTVSVFSVEHDVCEGACGPYSQAWSLYVCDSHGTQPWSYGKASITGITFGTSAAVNVDAISLSTPRSEIVVDEEEHATTFTSPPHLAQRKSHDRLQKLSTPVVLNVEEGLTYFSTILFTLLEEHRRAAPSNSISSSVEIAISSPSVSTSAMTTNKTTPSQHPASPSLSSSSFCSSLHSAKQAEPKDLERMDPDANDNIHSDDLVRARNSANSASCGNSQGSLCSTQIPYMTWTPLRRRRSLAFTADELKAIIDDQWIPCVLADASIQQQVRRFKFAPLECFWNLRPTSSTS